MTELDAFMHWRDQQQHRITGWTIWMASLAHRGIEDVQASRPAFNKWLASVRLTDWIDFYAWMAASVFADSKT